MPEGTGASFIPKTTSRIKRPRTSKRIYIFSYVTYVLFFGTLLAVVGTYVYAGQVDAQRQALAERLADESTRFNDGDIARVRDLEKRIVTAERLLNESNAPSRIFEALESVIVDSVRIVRFMYERSNTTVVLTFASASETFDSAILQRNLFESVPGLASTDVATYSYSESAAGNQEEEAFNSTERLIVTFTGSMEASVFPYEPRFDPSAVTTDASATSSAAATTSSDVSGSEEGEVTPTTESDDNEQ